MLGAPEPALSLSKGLDSEELGKRWPLAPMPAAEEITHFLHSLFGCKCEIMPDDPGIFENPWNDEKIQTSGLARARFWIDIGIGNYLVPMIRNTLDILDSRIVSITDEVFAVGFTQGCFCNDD